MKRMMQLWLGMALGTAALMPAYARGSHAGYHRSASIGEHRVSGYTRSNGIYVAPHWQTNPNATRDDNYSTRGNVNPHTGEAGTKPRDEDTTSIPRK